MFTIFQGGLGTKSALSITFNALGKSIGSLMSTFTGQATMAIGTTYAMSKAIQALSDAYNLSYDSAMKNTSNHLDELDSTKSEIENLKSQAEEYNTTLSSLGEKYDVDLSGLDSIDEKISALQDSGKIELIDQVEIDKISEANSKLESQLSIKEKLSLSQQKDAAHDAKDTLNRGKQSVAQQVAQQVPGGKKTYQGMVSNVNVATAVKEDIAAIEKYENKVSDLEKSMSELDPKSKEWKQSEKDIASYNKAIEKLTEDLDSKEVDLDKLLSATSVNGEGLEALKGFEDEFKEVKSAYDAIGNMGLLPTEKDLSQIESYFNGSKVSNGIKDSIIQMLKSGEVDNATDALHKLGVTLNDIGITSEGKKAVFDDYFAGLIDSAKEAENAVKGIDGSVEGVKSAFESENQDSDWNSMTDFLKQAQELYENGKVGTDDFKAAAQFMSPAFIDPDSTKYDADAYVATWEAAYDKVQRYFDSENPAQSVANFTNDLVDNGIAIRDIDGDVTWQFKNSAETAKKLGLSVEATEVAMHNLEAYGAEFDDVMFSGEGLERYKTALENIKNIYDEMDDSSGKNRLGKIIDDSEISDFENNLDALTEDQIIKIEFEYDLATVQQQIDELKNGMMEGGTTQEYASLMSAQKKRRDMLVEQEDLSSAISDSGYANSLTGFDNLAQKLITEYDTLGETGRRSIQQQQSAILDLQNTYLDMFQSGDVADWETFLNTESANNIIEKLATDMGTSFEDAKNKLEDNINLEIDADTSDAESKIDGIIGNDGKTITMFVDATTEQIQSQLNQLQNGQRLLFKAEVDGNIVGIEAIKNEDGTITYTADMGDVEQTLEAHTNEDGTITYTVNEVEGTKVDKDDKTVNKTVNEVEGTKVSKKAESATQVVDQLLGKKVPTKAPDATQTVNRIIGRDVGSSLPSITQTVYRTVVEQKGKASGTLLSPSHVNGTAYNMLNLKSAYADGKVSLPKDEKALVNEIGQESLIRDGVWSLLPGKMHIQSLKKGDIILNAEQTRDLLKSGKTNSHARAYANGTLLNSYANGFRLPTGVINNSSSSYSSNLNKSSNSNTANANTSSAAASLAKAAEDLKDFVEIYLDRASDLTQKQIDAIDRAVGLADKQNQNAKAISNVQSEITKNRQAYDRYMQQANSVGLSESYASQIRDGSLNIENITDETLSKNIKSYEEWYNKAKDCLDKVTELQDKERELAIERLEQIEDFYKLVTDVQEALQKANDAKVEFSDAMGFSAVSDSVRKTYQESLNAAEEIYTNLTQQLVDYQNEFNDLISKGYIQKYSDEWYEGYAKIHEFNEAIDSAGVSIVDFEDKIREITYTKIQQLIDGFERAMDKLDARIDLMESRDETVPESLYQKQLDANNSRITGNKQMRDAKLEEQALYAVDSKRYQELAEEINKLDTETLGLMEDNEKLKDTIFELRFTPLEEGIEKMESLRGELKDFMNLLNEDAYFDKKGGITSEGVAALALLEQSMYSAKQEIADYRKGLDKLQESFDNGVISEVEFNEKSEEYRKGIRDSIADVQDYSETLTKLYLNQMKQENEYLQKIIDKRKEALKAKADYYDYDKKIRSQSKDVNMLKSQIAALEGVNNASAQAELKRLKQQLSDAEDELSETKRDHAIDMQEKGYDTMSDELNEILENTEYEIVHNADKQQSVIQSMLQNVVSMYSSAYGKINEIIHNTGWVGSTDFNSNQSNLSTQEGAVNQVTNATQHQSNVSSTGTAQSTVTSPIKNNDSFNHDFEQEIYQDPNVDNRPVAELKLSQKSITLEEGKSTSISAQIRPTDAKNKTLSWKSSNEKVATVSNGTIKAIKPGSCQVTASTTDGSGISASVGVTVTKKPDPPKPVVNTPSSSSGGDGIPRVGDVVTLLAGQRYYYSSWGTSPAGNRYAGVPGGVVIDAYSGTEYGGQSGNHGDYGIHIRSADGVYGDLGWVSLSQITGYNKGTKRVPKDGLALFDETADGKSKPGSEVIVTKYGTLKQFDAGDMVFANDQVKRLYDWSSEGGMLDTVRPVAQEVYTPTVVPTYTTQNVEVHFDQLVTITDSTITKDSVSEMKGVIKDCIPMIKKEVSSLMYKDAKMSGVRKLR